MYSHFPIKRDQKDLNMLSIKIFTHADVAYALCFAAKEQLENYLIVVKNVYV